MSAHDGRKDRRTSLSSGLTVTALVVVVGVAAAVADLGTPGRADVAAHAVGPIIPAVATTTVDGFRVPDTLRINAADVPPHVDAF